MGHKINVLAFVRITENWKSFCRWLKNSKASWGMKYFKTKKMFMKAGREEIPCLVMVNTKVFLSEKPSFWKSRLWNKKKNYELSYVKGHPTLSLHWTSWSSNTIRCHSSYELALFIVVSHAMVANYMSNIVQCYSSHDLALFIVVSHGMVANYMLVTKPPYPI